MLPIAEVARLPLRTVLDMGDNKLVRKIVSHL